jgi:hypothetical protein
MYVATDAEVRKWLVKAEPTHGIRVDGTTLYYAEPGANCLELTFPEEPLRVTYFARVASMISTIGRPQVQKSGWKLVEKMRQGVGENRSLEMAREHFFRDDELVDLTAFLVPCFVYGWDAYLVPYARSDFFVHISHDEYWGIVTRTQEAYEKLFSELKGLNPKQSTGCVAGFVGQQRRA